jgi:ferredoxin
MSSSMPATRSRCDSNSNSSRSRCASSLMRSAPTRRLCAVMLRSNSHSNSRCRSGTRCRTCRNSLVNSPKVRLVSLRVASLVAFFGIRLRIAACAVLTVMLLPSCSRQAHVQLPRVESESQSPRFRPAEVRGIFAPPPVTPPDSFTHAPTSYRNTPDSSSSSGTGTSTGTSYVAQPPSPGLDRHAQQAYYAPRVSPNPQPGTINQDFES